MDETYTWNVTRPNDKEILLRRSFDAPRQRVFEALTRPGLIGRWFGSPTWPMVACEVDLQVGGSYRYVLQGPDSASFTIRGTFREVVPPERLVYTEAYDGEFAAWGDLVIATDLVESAGKTLIVASVMHPSREIRDANSGMERGAAEAYDRLDAVLASGD